MRARHLPPAAHTGARNGYCGPGGGPGMQAQAARSYGASGAERRYYLPFDSEVAVAAGATVVVTADPQLCILIDDIVITSDIAFSFTLDAFTIGRTPQAVAVGASRGAVWSETSYRVHGAWDSAGPGTEVSATVTNTAAVAIRFMLTAFGGSSYG